MSNNLQVKSTSCGTLPTTIWLQGRTPIRFPGGATGPASPGPTSDHTPCSGTRPRPGADTSRTREPRAPRVLRARPYHSDRSKTWSPLPPAGAGTRVSTASSGPVAIARPLAARSRRPSTCDRGMASRQLSGSASRSGRNRQRIHSLVWALKRFLMLFASLVGLPVGLGAQRVCLHVDDVAIQVCKVGKPSQDEGHRQTLPTTGSIPARAGETRSQPARECGIS